MILNTLRVAYRARFTAVVSLALSGLILLAWSNRFIQDDAFISFRYAHNLAHGKGLVWNEGERTEGYTNFLYTIIMSAPIGLGFDPVVPSYAFGLITFALSLVFTYALASRIVRSENLALLAVLLLGTNYTFSAYATAGMETQLQAALFVISAYVLVRAMEGGAWKVGALITLSLLLSAALLTRLDSALLALVVLPLALRGSWRGARPAQRVLRVLSALLPLVAVVGPWLVWKAHYYGGILPNTYYVKAATLTSLPRGATYVWLFFRSYWLFPFLLLLPCFIGRLRRGTDRRLLVPLGMVALWILYTIRVGGDFMEFRFLVPILPLWFVCVGWIIGQVRPVVFRIALALMVVAGSVHHARHFTGAPIAVEPVADLSRHLTDSGDGWVEIGRALGEALDYDPSVTIAVGASGAIPFYSRLKTVDLFGLNDQWVARHGLRFLPIPGHQRMARFDYLMARETNLAMAYPKTRDAAVPFTVSRTSVLPFVPMLSDDERVPPDARILEIPIGPKRTLFALYLARHPRVDAATERYRWRTHRYDLWNRGDAGRSPHVPMYHPGTRIDLTSAQGDAYLPSGWSGHDWLGLRWTTGSRAAIVFGLERPMASVLRIMMRRFLYSDARATQPIAIELNGRRIAVLSLTAPEPREHSITLPGDLVRNENTLTFALPDGNGATAAAGDAAPPRLGLSVEWMDLEALAVRPPG